MQSEDLVRILEGEITHAACIDIGAPTLRDVCIIVCPTHLKRILSAYLNGEINDVSLNLWAQFVSQRGEYVTKCFNEDDEKYDDTYELMWDIINYIATPEIDGAITPELIHEYLNKIEMYFDNNGNEIDYKLLRV